MACDNFHFRVEKEFRKMKNIYDFPDYVACVKAARFAVEFIAGDFWEWSVTMQGLCVLRSQNHFWKRFV